MRMPVQNSSSRRLRKPKTENRQNLILVPEPVPQAAKEPYSPKFVLNREALGLSLLVALAALFVYAPVIHYPFVNYDDPEYVFKNAFVRSGLSWENVRWAFTGMAVGNWHPLTWISHQLDCTLFALNAGGHHFTSLVLHAVNSVLLFLLLWRATGAIHRSALVASLFALHPFNVETVAWIAERKNLLCTLFFLLALGAYGWYVRKPGGKRYLAVAVLFMAGLASKPMVVTLPFVLLLMDFWPLERVEKWSRTPADSSVPQLPLRALVFEKVPLFALIAISVVLTIVAQRKANAIATAWSLWPRLENGLHSYATYFWKSFLPLNLAPFYPDMLLGKWQVALSAGFVIGVGVLVWKARRPYLTVGYLWFLGTLVPVIGIVQVGAQAMADRYAYIPLIGIFMAAVWGLADLGKSLRWNSRMLLFGGIDVVLVLAAVTCRQVGYWKSSYDLWTHELQVTISNLVGEENLAIALADMHRYDEALPHFENAREIRPDDATALLNIGTTLDEVGRHQEAIEAFETVVRTNKDVTPLTAAYRGLGVAYASLGDRQRARENFMKALALSPSESSEMYNLSMLEVEDGIDRLSKALAANPTPEGYVQLGGMLEQDRQLPKAQVAYQKALALDPNLADAKQALSALNAGN